jgi:small subunit ribosomal protein S16
MGAKNDPCYRVVAADSRSPRDGRFLEILGWYDPTRKGDTFSLNMERIDYWKSRGAQLSKTVASLVRSARRAVGA